MDDGTLNLFDHGTDRVPVVVSGMSALALQRLEEAAEKARNYAGKAKAPNTLRSYRAAWDDFAAWCTAGGRTALPALPATLAMYLADRADTHKAATLQHRLAAISQAHQKAASPISIRAVTRRCARCGRAFAARRARHRHARGRC